MMKKSINPLTITTAISRLVVAGLILTLMACGQSENSELNTDPSLYSPERRLQMVDEKLEKIVGIDIDTSECGNVEAIEKIADKIIESFPARHFEQSVLSLVLCDDSNDSYLNAWTLGGPIEPNSIVGSIEISPEALIKDIKPTLERFLNLDLNLKKFVELMASQFNYPKGGGANLIEISRTNDLTAIEHYISTGVQLLSDREVVENFKSAKGIRRVVFKNDLKVSGEDNYTFFNIEQKMDHDDDGKKYYYDILNVNLVKDFAKLKEKSRLLRN